MQDLSRDGTAPRTTVASAGHLVSRKTPVLFCSNRGLFLRTSNNSTTEYSVDFCDIERWNNSRLTSIGLTPADASDISSFNRFTSTERRSDVRIVSQNS
ncbi:uncharacterized protein LOC132256590 [Phlebotomus argentipes]|uniref:uncharacterized protein LOC132256590 n=1 Tax=Phlebotomus argentipes TaxID=94469 RepID=UPI002893279B|nr:uncharacterized protein LOC132256590 [Phlebotomus argentipes]